MFFEYRESKNPLMVTFINVNDIKKVEVVKNKDGAVTDVNVYTSDGKITIGQGSLEGSINIESLRSVISF